MSDVVVYLSVSAQRRRIQRSGRSKNTRTAHPHTRRIYRRGRGPEMRPQLTHVVPGELVSQVQ